MRPPVQLVGETKNPKKEEKENYCDILAVCPYRSRPRSTLKVDNVGRSRGDSSNFHVSCKIGDGFSQINWGESRFSLLLWLASYAPAPRRGH